MNKLNLIDYIKQKKFLSLDPITSQDDLIALGTQMAALHVEKDIDCLNYFESLDWANFEDITRYQNQHILMGLVEKITAPTMRLYSFFHNLAQQFPLMLTHIMLDTFDAWASHNTKQLKALT